MLRFFRFGLTACFISGATLLGAQPAENYTLIPLNDLSAFESRATGWKTTPEVMMNPTSSTVMSKDGSGGGILVGTAGQKLLTRATMQDLKLRLDFMLSPGAQAYVTLPGGARVLLSEGGSVTNPTAATSGYAGLFPTQNATKSAGLWQTLEVAYDASTRTEPGTARLNSVVLNGVIVQQGEYIPLSAPVAKPQPLALEVTKGTVAFRNVGYQSLVSRKPLSVGNLSYKLFADAWATPVPVKLEREAKTTVITQEFGNGLREYHLIFQGDMQTEEAGEYVFTMAQSGPGAQLTIDGKEVLAVGESTSQTTHSGRVTLSKGTHPFTLRYLRFPWWAPALGLSVAKAGVRPYDLTALSSLPVPAPKPYLGVNPDGRPEMIRSFVLYANEKQKRTHVLSVGNPAGWHYTFDLNRGALLQAWRGQFADVTEMWYERGEPQLLTTAGLTVPISGKSSYAVLDDNAAWPDSADLNYLGYRLNAEGVPTLRYGFRDATLSDQLVATTHGLTRTLSLDGKAPTGMQVMLGSGDAIVQVEKGLYRIDDRYYVRVDKNANVRQRTSAGKQELMLPVNGNVSYELFW